MRSSGRVESGCSFSFIPFARILSSIACWAWRRSRISSSCSEAVESPVVVEESEESSPGRERSFEDGVDGVVDFDNEDIEEEGVEPVGVGREEDDVDVEEIEGCVGERNWLLMFN